MICNGNFIAWNVPKYGVFSGPFSARIQESTAQKKLRIWTIFTQCFLRKQLAGESCHCFCKNVPSQMFGKVLNMPPKMILQSILNKDCNLELYTEH